MNDEDDGREDTERSEMLAEPDTTFLTNPWFYVFLLVAAGVWVAVLWPVLS